MCLTLANTTLSMAGCKYQTYLSVFLNNQIRDREGNLFRLPSGLRHAAKCDL
jgi:hypothetical protein